MVNCNCGHCECDDEKETETEAVCDCKSTEDKLDSLKKAIIDLGYKIEETEKGIRISE